MVSGGTAIIEIVVKDDGKRREDLDLVRHILPFERAVEDVTMATTRR